MPEIKLSGEAAKMGLDKARAAGIARQESANAVNDAKATITKIPRKGAAEAGDESLRHLKDIKSYK